VLGVAIAMILVVPRMASAQEQKTTDQATPANQAAPRAIDPKTEKRTVGTVVDMARASIVVKTDDGMYAIYTIAATTFRGKQSITAGSRVSVITMVDDTAVAPTALAIDVMPKPEGLAAAPAPAPTDDNVPVQIRQLESQIAKQARRYRAGFQIGAGLDPELISLSGHSSIGPVFNSNINFRPGLEFAFGEVTTLFGIHLDAIFTLPSMTRARWAPYIGVGPSFSFSHRGFSAETDTSIETVTGQTQEVSRFDFGDFSWNNGLNFIVGVKAPSGMSFELKATPYGISKVRILGGFEF
jgi:hypothetical protein